MEMGKLKTLVVFTVLALGLLTEKSYADPDSFRDCYSKCFIFCMIEPASTLCSCTTHCLKDCIFQQFPHQIQDKVDSANLGFCKLGCAFSSCSNISTKHKPNGDEVSGCVGSCSTRCTKGYISP